MYLFIVLFRNVLCYARKKKKDEGVGKWKDKGMLAS